MLFHPETIKLRDSLKKLSFLQSLLFPRKLRKVLEDESSTDYVIFKSYFQSTNFFHKWFIGALRDFFSSYPNDDIARFVPTKIFDAEEGELNFNQILHCKFPYTLGNAIILLKKEGLLSGIYSEFIRKIIQQDDPCSIREACDAIIKLSRQGLLTEANLLLLESSKGLTHLKLSDALIKLHRAGLLSQDSDCVNRQILYKLSGLLNLNYTIDVLILLHQQTNLFTGLAAEKNRLMLLANKRSSSRFLQPLNELVHYGLLQGDKAQEIFEVIINLPAETNIKKLVNALIILAEERRITQIDIRVLSQHSDPEGFAQLLKSSADFTLFNEEIAQVNINILTRYSDFITLSKFLHFIKKINIHRTPGAQTIFDLFVAHKNPEIFVNAMESASVLLFGSVSPEFFIKIGRYPNPEIIASLLAITQSIKLFFGNQRQAEANFNFLIQYRAPELLLNFLKCVQCAFSAGNTHVLFNLIKTKDLQNLLIPLSKAKEEELLISSSGGGENLEAIMEHANPEALISAFIYLKKNSLLTSDNRNWLTQHQNIGIVNRTFCYLSNIPDAKIRKFFIQNFIQFSSILLNDERILNLMEHIPISNLLLRDLINISQVMSHDPIAGQNRILAHLRDSNARMIEYHSEYRADFERQSTLAPHPFILGDLSGLYALAQRYNPTLFETASSAASFTSLSNAEILERKGISEVPEEFICPITSVIMDNPVYILGDSTNQRFEKKDIEEWLQGNTSHPLTRASISVSDLIEDSNLKQKIFQFVHSCRVTELRMPS